MRLPAAVALLVLMIQPASAYAESSPATRAIYGLKSSLLGGRAATLSWLSRNRFNAVFGGYRDATLRRSLKKMGIKVYAELALFVGKRHWRSHPGSRPINARGRPIRQQGWYAGVCPNQPWLRRQKLHQATRLVRKHRVDGIWLDFIRYPARWDKRPARFDTTCFCARCLATFARWSKLQYPAHLDTTAKKASWILEHHRDRFITFKVDRIVSFVAEVRSRVKRIDPQVLIGLFGVPWREGERGGAIRTVLGQDYRRLARHVDVLSPMLYHRMVGQNTVWISDFVSYLHKLTKRPVLPVVQVCSVPDRLTDSEMNAALQAGSLRPSAGVVLFSLKHFIREKRGAAWRSFCAARRAGRFPGSASSM